MQGVILYLVIYMAMTLGAFACILAMRRDGEMVEDIDSLAGLARTKPATAFLFAAILFSLAGIPPLAGFFAKYYVFLAAIQAGALCARRDRRRSPRVVGAYYYLRIVKLMYFDEPVGAFEPVPAELQRGARRLRRADARLRASSPRRWSQAAGAAAQASSEDGVRARPKGARRRLPARRLRHDRLDQHARRWRGRGHGIPAGSGSSPQAQTAGHGRRGRPWETPRGNLAASLLLVLPDAQAAVRHARLRRRAGA